MSGGKRYRKVFYEMFTPAGYAGRYVYKKRHTRFSEEDVPRLYANRPYRQQEDRPPEYRYRIAADGIHIALLYSGASLPGDEE